MKEQFFFVDFVDTPYLYEWTSSTSKENNIEYQLLWNHIPSILLNIEDLLNVSPNDFTLQSAFTEDQHIYPYK